MIVTFGREYSGWLLERKTHSTLEGAKRVRLDSPEVRNNSDGHHKERTFSTPCRSAIRSLARCHDLLRETRDKLAANFPGIHVV